MVTMARKIGRVSLRKRVHRRKGSRKLADAMRAKQRESTDCNLQSGSNKECSDSTETINDKSKETTSVCSSSQCMVEPCNSCLAEKQKVEVKKRDMDNPNESAISKTAQAQSALIEKVKEHLKKCRRKLI